MVVFSSHEQKCLGHDVTFSNQIAHCLSDHLYNILIILIFNKIILNSTKLSLHISQRLSLGSSSSKKAKIKDRISIITALMTEELAVTLQKHSYHFVKIKKAKKKNN